MKRREFITLVGGAAVTGAIASIAISRARAQTSTDSPRLAIFSPAEPAARMHGSENRYYGALSDELRRLGYVEGQNLKVERYGKEENTSGPEALAAKIVRDKPDVIYVIGPGGKFFQRETAKIPIVVLTFDLVAQGLVQSLARPGGNITGVSVDAGPSIHGKRIDLLRQMFPAISKLAFLSFAQSLMLPTVRAAAEAAGIPLVMSLVEYPTSEANYRAAIATALRDGANAIMVADNPDTFTNRVAIANAIAEAKLPAIYPFAEFVQAGGLVAYSFDLVELNTAQPTRLPLSSGARILRVSRFIKPPNSNCPSTSRRRKRSALSYR